MRADGSDVLSRPAGSNQFEISGSSRTIFLKQFGDGRGFMKSRMVHRCLAIQVLSIDIRATVYQQLSDGSLVGMSRRMERRRSPVVILVSSIHIGAGSKK
jgi:hypothetical protein